MTTWSIWLDAWVIQDGNYPDFTRGQTAEFAVQLLSDNIRASSQKTMLVRALGKHDYKVTAQVVYGKRGIWIIDFGILAYGGSQTLGGQRLPRGVGVGDFVEASVWLGIDDSSYVERFSKRPGIPALIYTWRIDRIAKQSAPLIEHKLPNGRRFLERDQSQLGFEDIEQTNACSDDGGRAEYLLHCTLLDKVPKHTSATALS